VITRQKLLLGVLVLIVAGWQGKGLVDSLVFAPVDERLGRIKLLEKQIENKEHSQRVQRKAAAKFAEMKKRSLPPDPVIASREFQNWLIDLTNRAQFSSVSLDKPLADPRAKEETYYSIRSTIKGQATLERLCDLFYEILKSGLLVRVNAFKLSTDRHQGNPTLNVELTLEALALVASPERSTLFAGKDPPGPMKDQPVKERAEYAAATQKNLFVRGYNGPPAPPVAQQQRPPPVQEPPSTAEFVYFVGWIDRGGKETVWLNDRTTNEQVFLSVGSEFKLGGLSGKVLEISKNLVVVEIGDDRWRLELGQNLKQRTKVASYVEQPSASTAPSEAQPSTTASQEAPATAEADGQPPSQTSDDAAVDDSKRGETGLGRPDK
jgi:hypothetical protein